MSTQSTATSSSFPIFGVLGLIFVTLKLLGKITWSWWWVTAPFWGPLAIGVIFLIIITIFVSRQTRHIERTFRSRQRSRW